MFQKTNIPILKSIVLLSIFVLLKLGFSHAISHTFSHDDIADCEDCFLILDSNKNKTFDYHAYVYDSSNSLVVNFHKPVILLYTSPVISIYTSDQFFNKPPPSKA